MSRICDTLFPLGVSQSYGSRPRFQGSTFDRISEFSIRHREVIHLVNAYSEDQECLGARKAFLCQEDRSLLTGKHPYPRLQLSTRLDVIHDHYSLQGLQGLELEFGLKKQTLSLCHFPLDLNLSRSRIILTQTTDDFMKHPCSFCHPVHDLRGQPGVAPWP